jgi:hypothetical protein
MDDRELTVQIDYTDPLGNRRTVIKQIVLAPSALSTVASAGIPGGFSRTGAASQSSSIAFLSDKWFWVSIALLVVAIWGFVYGKKKRRD